jgi:hypothetical protein
MSGRMMNAVGRSTASPCFSTSVCANVVMTPARWPLPIQCLRPSRIHSVPSSLSRARVTMCCASEPVSGSVSAYAPSVSPRASIGRYRAFCSWVPYSTIAFALSPQCTATSTPIDGSRLDTAPNTCAYAAGERPSPPYSRGIEMPRKPSLASAWITSSGIRSSSSNRAGSIRPRLIRSSAASRRRTVRVSSGSRSSSVAGKGKRSLSSIDPVKRPRTKEGASSSLMAEA